MTTTSPMASASNTSSMDALIAWMVTFLLAVQLLSLAVFNLEPQKLRFLVDGLSVLAYAVLMLMALFYSSSATLVHLLGLILFAGAGLTGLFLFPERTIPTHFVDHITSPMLLGLLTMRSVTSPGRFTLWVLWLVCAVAAVLMAFQALHGPPVMLGGVQRLAVFAGGVDEVGIHPSAYATACLFLTVFVLWRAKVGPSLVNVLILGLLAYVIFRYEVRTVWLMLAIFAGFAALYWMAQRSMTLVVGGAGLALLGAAAILFFITNHGFDIATFSSGRTLIYAERLHLISGRGPLELLFGSGSGTDMFRGVSAWRWAQKDSHNDFLIVTIELGFVGLTGFLLMILAPLAALPPSRKGWMVMMAASSLVSNGVLLRPSIGAPIILLAWLSLALRERALEEAAQEEAWLEPEVGGDLAGAYGAPGLAARGAVSLS